MLPERQRNNRTVANETHRTPLFLGLDPGIVERIRELRLEEESREKFERLRRCNWRRKSPSGWERMKTVEESIDEWRPALLGDGTVQGGE